MFKETFTREDQPSAYHQEVYVRLNNYLNVEVAQDMTSEVVGNVFSFKLPKATWNPDTADEHRRIITEKLKTELPDIELKSRIDIESDPDNHIVRFELVESK